MANYYTNYSAILDLEGNTKETVLSLISLMDDLAREVEDGDFDNTVFTEEDVKSWMNSHENALSEDMTPRIVEALNEYMGTLSRLLEDTGRERLSEALDHLEFQDEGIWLCGEEYLPDLDLDFVAALQVALDLEKPFVLQTGWGCDKPRLDAFGGSLHVIWKGGGFHTNTGDLGELVVKHIEQTGRLPEKIDLVESAGPGPSPRAPEPSAPCP